MLGKREEIMIRRAELVGQVASCAEAVRDAERERDDAVGRLRDVEAELRQVDEDILRGTPLDQHEVKEILATLHGRTSS